MPEPILIIHGVANHEEAPFLACVRALQEKLGAEWELLPVFWGDLGGASTDINDCLPTMQDGRWQVRSINGPSFVQPLTRADIGPGDVKNDVRSAIIAKATVNGNKVRSAVGVDNAAVEQRVADTARVELPTTKVLQFVDDPEVLRSVGLAIRAAVDAADATHQARPVQGGQYAVRAEDVRGLLDPIASATQKIIHSIDDLMGRLLGDRLGRLNQQLRGAVAAPFAGFLGDVFVYQRNQAAIQQRLWDALAKHGQGYGTKDKPVHAVAHSLGGVITFDAAVHPDGNGRQLWLKSFTTFGSQAAFFHIMDRRRDLAPYQHNEPVVLPPTIGRWFNLWDAVDFLAFTAGTVFRLHDHTPPRDIPVYDSLTELVDNKLFTHSIYWNSEELITALKEILA